MRASTWGLARLCAIAFGLCGGVLGGGCGDDDGSADARPGSDDARAGGDGAAPDGAGPDGSPADAGPPDAPAADGVPGLADAPPVPDAPPAMADAVLIAHDARTVPDAGLVPVPDGALPPLVDAAVPDLPDAGVPGFPREIDGRITINELMAYNAITVVDDTGVAADWIELHNPTDTAVPLGGYALSDAFAVPRRAILPAGVTVPAHGYLVLWLDAAPEKGAHHLGFHLTRAGGEVILERPDGTPIDRLVYGAQEVDFSAAREPDDSSHWAIEWHPSPGGPNPAGPGSPMGLEDPAAPPEVVPPAGDLSERLLGYDVVPSLEILVSAADAARLETDPRTYVPATLIFDGRAYGPVGLRLKGQNSFQPFSAKPSLRVNIDEYVPAARFFGLKDLTLNNMDNDPSMMHERLAYYVARQAGVPASRANHLLLTVNGAFYGLYANVETVKQRMLARWFGDAEGPLYEGTDVDFAPAYVPAFELETGVDDRSLLNGLATALTTSPADAAIAAASAYMDMPAFQRFWAMEAVVGQFDSLPYSNPGDDFYVYADPTSGRLRLLPWGMDESYFSSSFDVLSIRSVLATTCLASSACFQAFVDEAWDVLALTEALDLAGERTRVAAQIAPYVALDTKKPYTTTEVNDSQADLGWFISERRARLTEMLPPPSP